MGLVHQGEPPAAMNRSETDAETRATATQRVLLDFVALDVIQPQSVTSHLFARIPHERFALSDRTGALQVVPGTWRLSTPESVATVEIAVGGV